MFLSLFGGTCICILICLVGDKICNLSYLQPRRGVRAVVDNLTHGLVGGISWWLLVGFKQPNLSVFNNSRLNQSLFCILLASLIDVDHFIASGSIHMEDVINLPHRPPMHCSGLCLIATGVLWFMSKYYPGMVLLPYEWLLSFSSHHIRDATRRGLWIIPLFLSTKPLPYNLYLALIAILPPLLSLIVPLPQPLIKVANIIDI